MPVVAVAAQTLEQPEQAEQVVVATGTRLVLVLLAPLIQAVAVVVLVVRLPAAVLAVQAS